MTAFRLNPELTSLQLIDGAVGSRLPAAVAAVTADNADFEQGQWAGIYILQECVQLLEALSLAPAGADTPLPEVEAAAAEGAGAASVVELLRNVGRISDETAGRDGGRAYGTMCDAIEATLRQGLAAPVDTKRGILFALSDLFCNNADGAGVPKDSWAPLEALAREWGDVEGAHHG
jgi:hypothetical protein